MGNPRWLTADILDISEGGIGVSIVTALAVGTQILLRGNNVPGASEGAVPASVRWCTERVDGRFHVGLELLGTGAAEASQAPPAPMADPDELDCYETMQLSPNADFDTIQRVYRMLAQRYHPDTPQTGDKEAFLRLSEAHRILSDPEQRARYDARYRETKRLNWKIFDQAKATAGPEGEQRKRHGILELLYAKTIHDPDRAAMTVFDFEQLLNCPREHLQAALWYLKGKGFLNRGDNGRFTITVLGFDEVERHAQPAGNGNHRLLEPGQATQK